jgi:hypothetical protein
MEWILAGVGALIIIGLSIYAGRLLFLLQMQKNRHQQARDKRIESMTTSIQTIAFAMRSQPYCSKQKNSRFLRRSNL